MVPETSFIHLFQTKATNTQHVDFYSPCPSLGHVDQTLQRRGHPGLLPLHEHHPSVDVDDDAPERVQLLALVPLGHQRHEDDVVLLGLGLDQVFEVGGQAGADAPLGHALGVPALLQGLVLEVLPPLDRKSVV